MSAESIVFLISAYAHASLERILHAVPTTMNKIFDGVNIVMVGSFNPGIFQPAWFEKNGLMPKTETDAAEIEIINNDAAIFTMSWVRIEVIAGRFVARTENEAMYSPLRDLVIGIFSLLEHSPINKLGLNREVRFQLPDETSWHSIGHTIAPKKTWEEQGLKSVGLKTITMEAERGDGRDGIFNITVTALSTPKYAVGISFNDHYELRDAAGAGACAIIEENWEKSISRSLDVCTKLIVSTSGQQ